LSIDRDRALPFAPDFARISPSNWLVTTENGVFHAASEKNFKQLKK
jgi:hypothetical protein